jgi:hypothetical protein
MLYSYGACMMVTDSQEFESIYSNHLQLRNVGNGKKNLETKSTFLHGLFRDLSNVVSMQSRMVECLINDELVIIWKETDVV